MNFEQEFVSFGKNLLSFETEQSSSAQKQFALALNQLVVDHHFSSIDKKLARGEQVLLRIEILFSDLKERKMGTVS